MGLFSNSEPEPVEIEGRPLRCLVCDNDRFHRREAQLHGALATFFDFEWSSPSASCYICGRCGYIHWFA